MKMFLRLGIFVFLGIVFLFVVSPPDSQSPSLEILAHRRGVYEVGDTVAAVFLATIAGVPAVGSN